MTATNQDYPEVQIANGDIEANLYLPDRERGFYRSTRFDWSGVISSLKYRGHEYYGAWYSRREPRVRDFIFQDSDIIAGPQSAIMGPAEEFVAPQGYAAAKLGGTFVKIGVGVLRKAVDADYSCYDTYEIVDSGKWSIRTDASSVEFTQLLADAISGYGYVYRKKISLISNRPELVIDHSLNNTGRVPIRTTQYNHNFLTLDRAAVGAGSIITFPFQIRTTSPPDQELAEINGEQITYLNQLQGSDVVSFPIHGFSEKASDYTIQIDNRSTGAGLRITGNRPLVGLALWSIRSVLSIEPFIDVSTEPGRITTWDYRYEYQSAGEISAGGGHAPRCSS